MAAAGGTRPRRFPEGPFRGRCQSRLGSVEDAVDTHDRRIDALASRVAALEARANDTADTASVEIAQYVNDSLRLALGKRRSRRRPAAARK